MGALEEVYMYLYILLYHSIFISSPIVSRIPYLNHPTGTTIPNASDMSTMFAWFTLLLILSQGILVFEHENTNDASSPTSIQSVYGHLVHNTKNINE